MNNYLAEKFNDNKFFVNFSADYNFNTLTNYTILMSAIIDKDGNQYFVKDIDGKTGTGFYVVLNIDLPSDINVYFSYILIIE